MRGGDGVLWLLPSERVWMVLGSGSIDRLNREPNSKSCRKGGMRGTG